MAILEEKKKLRSQLRILRRAIQPKRRAVLDEAMLHQVLRFSWYREADTVLLYASCGGEPDTLALIRTALRDGKAVALPRCLADGRMEFILIASMEELSAGAYGILEPVGSHYPILTEQSLCIVPGVAFNSKGARLGQGGGYYDRFLAEHPQLRTVGLCYTDLLQETIPCEAHDCRVDAVITEKSVEVCNVIKI